MGPGRRCPLPNPAVVHRDAATGGLPEKARPQGSRNGRDNRGRVPPTRNTTIAWRQRSSGLGRRTPPAVRRRRFGHGGPRAALPRWRRNPIADRHGDLCQPCCAGRGPKWCPPRRMVRCRGHDHRRRTDLGPGPFQRLPEPGRVPGRGYGSRPSVCPTRTSGGGHRRYIHTRRTTNN